MQNNVPNDRNLSALISTFKFHDESVRAVFLSDSQKFLEDSYKQQEKAPRYFLTNFLEYISQYSRNIGNHYGVVLYPYKDVKTLTLEDFKVINTFESVFKFLSVFLNKNYSVNVYSRDMHLCELDMNSIVGDDIFKLFSYLNYFTDVHSILALSRPDLFSVGMSSKGKSFTKFKVLTRVGKDAHIYCVTPNYTTSKFDSSSVLFPEASLDLLKRNIELGTSSPTFRVFEGKKHTFGLEIETSNGFVPDHLYSDLNVSCVYDGSLKDDDGVARGGEYVTGVLTGDAGVNQVKKLMNTLVETNCEVNNKCSVHVHVGSAKFTKTELVAMYMLGVSLEEEIFSMFPRSRAENVYCRKLGRILSNDMIENLANFKSYTKEEFEKIIDYIFDLRLFPYVKSGNDHLNTAKTLANSSVVKPSRNENKKSGHPGGNKCGYDKNAQRYSWLNFVTCLYNNKGEEAKTLEFRVHNGTLNFKKVLAWLKICVAFTWFAENHQEIIFTGYYLNPENSEKEPINLGLVLKLAYPNSYKILLEYISERKGLFANKTNDKHAESEEYAEKINLVTSFKLKELFDFNS